MIPAAKAASMAVCEISIISLAPTVLASPTVPGFTDQRLQGFQIRSSPENLFADDESWCPVDAKGSRECKVLINYCLDHGIVDVSFQALNVQAHLCRDLHHPAGVGGATNRHQRFMKGDVFALPVGCERGLGGQ